MNERTGQQAQRKTASHQAIHDEIRDRICLLIYPPGSLLSENELAAEFGVSRTPVRRALHRLEFEGLVVSKHGIGTMVTSVDLREIKEVYALRYRLYDLMGDFSAANRVRDEDITELVRIRERLTAIQPQDRAPDLLELARLYMAFNWIVTQTISNSALRQISEQLFYQTSRIWHQMLVDSDWKNEVDIFMDELLGVIGALRNEDMHEVARVRQEHMAGLLNRIVRYVGGM